MINRSIQTSHHSIIHKADIRIYIYILLQYYIYIYISIYLRILPPIHHALVDFCLKMAAMASSPANWHCRKRPSASLRPHGAVYRDHSSTNYDGTPMPIQNFHHLGSLYIDINLGRVWKGVFRQFHIRETSSILFITLSHVSYKEGSRNRRCKLILNVNDGMQIARFTMVRKMGTFTAKFLPERSRTQPESFQRTSAPPLH